MYCSERDVISKRVDRGPAHMVQHYVIYSPERKKQWSQSKHLQSHSYKIQAQSSNCSLCFATDPPPSPPNGLFFVFFLHVVPVFTGFQLPFFPPLRRAGPGLTPSLYTSPVFLWIEATARSHVGHMYFIVTIDQIFTGYRGFRFVGISRLLYDSLDISFNIL